MNKIALFCSASDAIDPIYAEKAKELGEWMGEHRADIWWFQQRADGSRCRCCQRKRGNDYGCRAYQTGGTWNGKR